MRKRQRPAFTTRINRDLLRGERGVSLVISLAVLVALMFLGSTAIRYSTSNARSADGSVARNDAAAGAEAGLGFARSTLWNAADPTDPTAVVAQTVTVGDATVTYTGTYDAVAGKWLLSGVGSVPNPNPGAAPVTRSATEEVAVAAADVPDENSTSAWSTLYVDDWATCTDIQDGAVLEVELYVRGDLCMETNSFVSHLAGKVQVWGNIDLDGTAQIGTNMDKLPELHVAGGCKDDRGSAVFHDPCTPADSTYATTFSSTPENITMPPLDLQRWYEDAKPGPLHYCNNGTSLPAGVVFDNDANPVAPVANESAPSFELTTAAAYDCQYWEGGEMVGQLAWTGGTNGTLTIKGTVFFDSDIHVRPNVGIRADYDGQGTLYASGEIEVQEDVWLCGVAACDETWDPKQDLLVLVADGDGWHEGIDVEYAAKFQGGAFSLTEVDVSHGGEFWGSAITRRVEFINGTSFRQIPGGEFPVLEGAPQTTTPGFTVENVPGSYVGPKP